MSKPELDELPRLIDQTSSPLERAILGAGHRVSGSASHSDRRRTQVLLALGVGSTIAFGSKSSLALAAGWKKAVLGTVIVASGAAGIVAYQHASAPVQVEAPALVVPVRQEATEVTKESAQEPEAPTEVVEHSEPTTFEALPKAVAVESVPRRSPSRTRAKPAEVQPRREPSHRMTPELSRSNIQGEVKALDRARAALRGGNSGRAIEELRDYSRNYPSGSLRLEAEALRIEAFAASGNHAEASRRAKRILDRSPNSVLAARLRRFIQD